MSNWDNLNCNIGYAGMYEDQSTSTEDISSSDTPPSSQPFIRSYANTQSEPAIISVSPPITTKESIPLRYRIFRAIWIVTFFSMIGIAIVSGYVIATRPYEEGRTFIRYILIPLVADLILCLWAASRSDPKPRRS